MSGPGETASAATGPGAALRLIRSRNFGPYFVGNAASASGTWFQNLAAALLIYRQTHSPFLLGVLNFCTFVPVLVLAPWAGSAADRFDRRRVVLFSQLGSTALSATLAALAWSGLAPVPVVILSALGLGIGSAFAAPASFALVGDLVPRRELGSAVALNSMTYNLARAIGPALAGVSVHWLGVPASFAINSGSYLLLVVGVLVVRPAVGVRARRGDVRLRDSVALLREHPRLIAFLVIVAAVGFASDPINTEAPAFVRAYGLGSLDTWTGIVIGIFGAGAVSAAFLLAGRVAGSRRRMRVTLILVGGGVMGFSLTPWIGLGAVFLAVGGFGYLASNISATSRLQLEVEDHQRGRIMALWSVAFLGFRPAASLADGALAGAFGVRAAGVCLALPALAGAGLITVVQRRNRLRATAV
ncbi:MAG: MFS transporter [Gaiellaceae bacterium]